MTTRRWLTDGRAVRAALPVLVALVGVLVATSAGAEPSASVVSGTCLATGARYEQDATHAYRVGQAQSTTTYEIQSIKGVSCAFARSWVARLTHQRVRSDHSLPGGPPGWLCGAVGRGLSTHDPHGRAFARPNRRGRATSGGSRNSGATWSAVPSTCGSWALARRHGAAPPPKLTSMSPHTGRRRSLISTLPLRSGSRRRTSTVRSPKKMKFTPRARSTRRARAASPSTGLYRSEQPTIRAARPTPHAAPSSKDPPDATAARAASRSLAASSQSVLPAS